MAPKTTISSTFVESGYKKMMTMMMMMTMMLMMMRMRRTIMVA